MHPYMPYNTICGQNKHAGVPYTSGYYEREILTESDMSGVLMRHYY